MKAFQALLLGGLACALIIGSTALGTGSGDVTIKIRNTSGSGNGPVILGAVNVLEFWISNSVPLDSMSLAFEVSYQTPIVWVKPYGNRPAPPPPENMPCIQEYGDAMGAFDLGFLKFDDRRDNVSPDTFMFGGAASAWPLPVHSTNTQLYDIKFLALEGSYNYPDGFCVNNIFLPPSGTWAMSASDGSGSWAPTFNGQPNNGESDPSAPPVCYEINMGCKGCLSPGFTATPGAHVAQSHCSPFIFDFDAVDGNVPPEYPITYSITRGTIDPVTGVATVPPADSGNTSVLIIACNSGGNLSSYPFTITWTNNAPTITNAPTTVARVAPGGTYSYAFESIDADACDALTPSVSVSGTPPSGSYAIDSDGNFSFTPVSADSGSSYAFDISFVDNCGVTATCQTTVLVEPAICGDCDGNGMVNISDAVFLIGYIFGGGASPNPPSVGDVSCDSLVNITDAVYLIAYIFSSGPAPCTGC